MQSANLFFSVPLFKKNVSRFWPLWSLYTLVLFLMLPFHFLTQDPAWYSEPLQGVFETYVMHHALNPAIVLVYGVLVAMALWSYLYNPRSAGAMHALPLRRETIFLTNYITGLLFFLVPSLLIFLLSLLCQSIVGGVTVLALGLWLLSQSLMMLFFFSFATLLAFVTGHILALPVLYGIFNVLFFGLSFLLNDIFRQFVYGYNGSPILDWIGTRFSPLYMMLFELGPRVNLTTYEIDGIFNMRYLWIYALVGLVMAALALLLYRKRRLELAGEVIAVSWLRPVFKYGVGICGALTFGFICYGMFTGNGALRGFGGMLLFVLLCGALSYLATAMLIRKSFRVFKAERLGCGILLVVLLASMAAMEWDAFGVERRVPDREEVLAVYVSGSARNHSYFLQRDPVYIEAITEFHAVAAARKDEVAYWEEFYNSHDYIGGGYVEGGGYTMSPRDEYAWDYISIDYTLKSGAHLQRAYMIPINQDLLEDEASLAYAYDKLVNYNFYGNSGPDYDRDMLYQAEFVSSVGLELLDTLRAESEIEWTGYSHGSYYFTRDESLRLYDAVLADMMAGNLGHEYLLWSDEKRNTFAGDLNFYFRTENNSVSNAWMTISVDSVETLAVLADLGFQRGVDLFTWEEYYALEEAYLGYSTDTTNAAPTFNPDMPGAAELIPKPAPADPVERPMNELPPEDMNPNSSDVGSSF